MRSTEPVQLPLPVAELGEGPVWDPASGVLYWVDSPAGRVHCADADGECTYWDIGQPIGAVLLRASGGLLVTAADGFVTLDTSTGAVAPLAPVEPDKPDNRMNDAACDRSGRCYAGTMAGDESPGQGALYRLEPDHGVHRLFGGVGISNGIGWSPDDRLMYYVDSLAYRIDVFDYDAATGAIAGRRPLASLGGGGVMPDGLAVDAEGGVWVAVWGGGVVRRYSPGGKLTGEVRLPAANVTCPAFGGQDLDQLYITTADGPGSGAGALYSCPAGVTGLPAHPYRG
jgi:sugar lactone lactonase YvrE